MYNLIGRLSCSSMANAVSRSQLGRSCVSRQVAEWALGVQASGMHLQRCIATPAVQQGREAAGGSWARSRRSRYQEQEQDSYWEEDGIRKRSRQQPEKLTNDEHEEEQAAPKHTGQRFFVTCHPGLEPAVAQELSELGMQGIQEGRAGVSFWGSSVVDGYRATLWLRSAIRVLAQLGEGELETEPDVPGRRGADTLYEVVRNCGVHWQDVIPPGATFSIEPRLWSCTDISSTQLMWQRIKDAICDAVSDARGERPLPPPPGTVADVPLYCSAYQDHLVIYRDLSGTSLHRRGYRDVMHKSPLNEAAAAGMLVLGGWPDICKQEGSVLVDPMCGSGTLLLEAALIARNIAPGMSRDPKSWPFVRWPDFQPKAWKEAWQEARDARRPWKGMLYGNDIHPGALSLAMRDMKRAELQPISRLHAGDCRTWELPEAPSLVAVNPPWGRRIGQGQGGGPPSNRGGDAGLDEGLQEAWMSLSMFLRARCGGARALVMSGNKEALNVLRMRPSQKHKLTVGGVEAHMYQYQVLPPKQQ